MSSSSSERVKGKVENFILAAACSRSVVGQPFQNLERMESLVRRAAAQGAGLVLLPEAGLTGYANGSLAAEAGLDLESGPVRAVVGLAQEVGVDLSVGLIERAEPKRSYLSQLLIGKEGRILARYRKLHLGPTETDRFEAGKEVGLVERGYARLGFQLCFDAHFPELATVQALAGAELILAPHASPRKESPEEKRDRWLRYLPARAYDNTLFLAACNQVGDNGQGWFFAGVALILGPKGEVLASYTGSGPGLALARIEAGSLNRIRESRMGFFRASRRPELYRPVSVGKDKGL